MDNGKILQYLALILGIPGFLVACSLPPYRAVALLAMLVGIVLYFLYWIVNLPPWTIIEIYRKIEIKKPDGSLANATKKTIIKANHKGLTEFLHRNIRADGEVGNFKLGSRTVPHSDIEYRAGEYIIRERFKAMNRLQKRNSCLTYKLFNSFPNDTEFTGYLPDYFTKKHKLEIMFPANRLARNPRAYSGLGAETKALNSPELSSDGLTISWEGKDLEPGKSYTIEWDW